MKKNILFLFLLYSIGFFSQKKFSKEIRFITDNDLYTSTYDDRYYTNGIFLSFSYLSKERKEKVEKMLFEWSVGHQMYTPHKASVSSINEHDRPFAGYLFASFAAHKVYKNNSAIKTCLQLGVLGPNAFSKELQNLIHDLYGFKETVGWKYQIKNALAVNINTAFNLFLAKDQTNHFDISWINTGKIGTVFTSISSGFLTRIGIKSLQPLANSIAYQTNLNNKNTSYIRAIESFFFIKPTVRYAFYDATIQGSFLNTNSPITRELVPLIFNIGIGFQFTANQFNLGYTYNYNSNTSKNLRFDNGHTYGRIQMTYILR
jgi:hypothetical protein